MPKTFDSLRYWEDVYDSIYTAEFFLQKDELTKIWSELAPFYSYIYNLNIKDKSYSEIENSLKNLLTKLIEVNKSLESNEINNVYDHNDTVLLNELHRLGINFASNQMLTVINNNIDDIQSGFVHHLLSIDKSPLLRQKEFWNLTKLYTSRIILAATDKNIEYEVFRIDHETNKNWFMILISKDIRNKYELSKIMKNTLKNLSISIHRLVYYYSNIPNEMSESNLIELISSFNEYSTEYLKQSENYQNILNFLKSKALNR